MKVGDLKEYLSQYNDADDVEISFYYCDLTADCGTYVPRAIERVYRTDDGVVYIEAD